MSTTYFATDIPKTAAGLDDPDPARRGEARNKLDRDIAYAVERHGPREEQTLQHEQEISRGMSIGM